MSHQPGAQLPARERRRRKRVENDTGSFLLGHSHKVQHPSRQSAQEELKRMRNKVGVEFLLTSVFTAIGGMSGLSRRLGLLNGPNKQKESHMEMLKVCEDPHPPYPGAKLMSNGWHDPNCDCGERAHIREVSV